MYEDIEKLAFDFFMIFSKFEYALKKAGYMSGNNIVTVDWDRFARDYSSNFSICDDRAMKFLLEKPPKKQSIKNDELIWKDSELKDKAEADRLLIFVRRVRNNLFHGGKHNDSDIKRNIDLIRSCIDIIEECVKWDKDVKRHFDSATLYPQM